VYSYGMSCEVDWVNLCNCDELMFK
jgi:hypothetical protein